jgi:hypothetical protein
MTRERRRELVADVERAGGWLSGTAAPLAGSYLRALCTLALGLAIRARIVAAAAAERDADRAARRLRDMLESARETDQPACDPLALALVYALRLRSGASETDREAFVRACEGALSADSRGASIARMLGVGGPAARTPLRWSAELAELLSFGPAADVTAWCDRAEEHGLAVLQGGERRALALALSARAFSAARANAGFPFAARVFRLIAAERLDARAVRDAMRHVRAMQRADGAYGALPPLSDTAGDIRTTYHLPWTVLSIWTIHDAVAPRALVRCV